MTRITMSEHSAPHSPPSPDGETPPDSAAPEARRRLTLRKGLQLACGTGALITGLLALTLPSPYIVESPGPAFNTIDAMEDEPIISVDGAETYSTDGSLNLTTVFVSGAPTSTVRVPDVVAGWLRPTTDVVPQETVYPSGTTAEDVSQMNTAAMTSSQDLAVAAALEQLDIDYTQELSVQEFTDQAVEAGTEDLLQRGDQLIAAAGEEVTGLEGLRDAVNGAAGQPVELTVLRDGEEVEFDVPTYQEIDGDYYVGIMLASEFDFPVDVTIQLEGVGGPSAGLMFALGIIDTLTPGSLTGGAEWAGTGTVDPDGTVGAIGGIAQKVAGARSAGAEHFLAPRDNCAALEGRIPSGLKVYGVDDVEQAQQIVEAVRDGDEGLLAGLAPCGE